LSAPAPVSVLDLARGEALAGATFVISREDVDAYTGAVGDGNDYRGRVPPLCAVALALRSLQERLSLPDGTLHTSQEVEHLGEVRAGDALTINGRVAQRSERQGVTIVVLEYAIAVAGADRLRARTTIMAPSAAR
jgi:hypothetical protein